MGGELTGISATTTAIILEGATFDPISVRKTARALNLHSDSSQLFEKGLPVYQASVGLWRAVELLEKIAGAQVASVMTDATRHKDMTKSVPFDSDHIRKILGKDVSNAEMKTLLQRLGFKESGSARRPAFMAPWWRGDVTIVADLAEEIARLIGYHTFPARLPAGELIMPPPSLEQERRSGREYLLGAGFNEVITYSFLSVDLLNKCGLTPADAVAVENPLNDEFTHLRPVLATGGLNVIHINEGQNLTGRIFEIGRVFFPAAAGELPAEAEHISIMCWGNDDAEVVFRVLKGVVEGFMSHLGVSDISFTQNIVGLFHPGRTAQVNIAGQRYGYMGEIHPRWRREFGISAGVFACELNLGELLKHVEDKTFIALPAYPPVKRDLAFVVEETVPYQSIEQTIKQSSPLVRSVELFDIFRGVNVPAGKRSLAVHIEYRADDRTLTEAEIEKIHSLAAGHLRLPFGAEIRE